MQEFSFGTTSFLSVGSFLHFCRSRQDGTQDVNVLNDQSVDYRYWGATRGFIHHLMEHILDLGLTAHTCAVTRNSTRTNIYHDKCNRPLWLAHFYDWTSESLCLNEYVYESMVIPLFPWHGWHITPSSVQVVRKNDDIVTRYFQYLKIVGPARLT